MAQLITLKVGIYPYVPDLGKDNLQGLKNFVTCKFEERHPDIKLTVSTDWSPYDADKMAKDISDKQESFDVLEMDTILLGEVVQKGVVQPLDLHHYKMYNDLFPVGLDAVQYEGEYYALPTLHCANFLFELITEDVPQSEREILCSLERGDHSLGDLKEVVKRYHELKGVSPLIGDFRGKWTLSTMYLDAYVDVHGKK